MSLRAIAGVRRRRGAARTDRAGVVEVLMFSFVVPMMMKMRM